MIYRKEATIEDQESGVVICGITSYVGQMPRQASELYANNMFNLIEELCQIPTQPKNNAQNFQIDLKDEIAAGSVVVHSRELLWIPYAERLKRDQEKKKKEEVKKGEVNINMRALQPEKKEELIIVPSKAGALVEPLVEGEGPGEGESVTIANMDVLSSGIVIIAMTFIAMGLAYSTNYAFMLNFLAFILALIIGYIVVWGVNPLLHASLMSETNAISGIIVIGAMLQLYGYAGDLSLPSFFGATALLFASINVFGGFILTDRMLSMLSS